MSKKFSNSVGLLTAIAIVCTLLAVFIIPAGGSTSTFSSAFSVASYDTNHDGIISKGEALNAVVDYFNLSITKAQALEVVVAYFDSTPTPTPTPTPQLQVHFIDVGQGDCILLDQGDTDVLIDGGTGEINIVPILKNYVHGDIEVMVATHPHADHIGGLMAVMDNFKVDRIFTNGESYDTATYNNFMDKAWKETPEVDYLSRGDTFNSDSLTFKVLNPEESLPSDINGNSIVMELDYGNVSFLFTGDTQKDSEASMIAAGEIHHVTILKVAHHSSDTSSSLAFLNLVKPQVAIYMCGVNNTYGFPKADTLANLRAVGAQVYGTDVCGTITVTTDGSGYTVSTAKMCP